MGNISLIFSTRARPGFLLASLRKPNRALWWVAGGALITLLGSLYVPLVQRVFHFEQLSPALLAISLALGLCTLLWFERVKLVRRKSI